LQEIIQSSRSELHIEAGRDIVIVDRGPALSPAARDRSWNFWMKEIQLQTGRGQGEQRLERNSIAASSTRRMIPRGGTGKIPVALPQLRNVGIYNFSSARLKPIRREGRVFYAAEGEFLTISLSRRAMATA
jgi:hypothetical protein